jgi:hypothetical protein
VRAQPTLEIRSETWLILDVIESVEGSSLRLELRDDLNTPVAEAEIRVTAEGERPEAVRTDARGVALLPLDEPWLGRTVRAEFHGSSFLDGCVRELETTDGRAKVELVPTLDTAGRLPLDSGTQTLRVHARSSAGAGGLVVRVSDDAGRVLAEARTDDLGRAHLGVAPHDLGAPGPGRLRFESEATETHRAGEATVAVVRTLASAVQLDDPPQRARPGQKLIVRGILETIQGPLADQTVSLELRDTPVARAITDARGRFRLEHVVDDVNVPVMEGTVRYLGSDEGAEASESSRFVLTVRSPFPKWPFVILPLAFAAFLAFARKKRLEAPPARPRRPLRALFERPTRTLRVRIASSRGGHPVAGARLRLDGAEIATSDEDGALVADDLPLGDHRAEVEAEGFVRHAFDLTVPLRGQPLTNLVLIETREAATRAICEVARSRGAGLERIDASTHRELARHVERARGELDELADDVDRAFYGPSMPSEEEVRAIEDRSRRLQD